MIWPQSDALPPKHGSKKSNKNDVQNQAFGFYVNMPNWSPLTVMLFLVLIVLPLIMLFAFGWSQMLAFWSGQVEEIVQGKTKKPAPEAVIGDFTDEVKKKI